MANKTTYDGGFKDGAASRDAEVEALRKNDARYRMLRDGMHWPAVYGKRGWSRLGATMDGRSQLVGDTLDAAIDAALAARPEGEKHGNTN